MGNIAFEMFYLSHEDEYDFRREVEQLEYNDYVDTWVTRDSYINNVNYYDN